jgi:hypothetical protein
MLHGQLGAVTKALKKMNGRHLRTVNVTVYFPLLNPSSRTTERATKTRVWLTLFSQSVCPSKLARKCMQDRG